MPFVSETALNILFVEKWRERLYARLTSTRIGKWQLRIRAFENHLICPKCQAATAIFGGAIEVPELTWRELRTNSYQLPLLPLDPARMGFFLFCPNCGIKTDADPPSFDYEKIPQWIEITQGEERELLGASINSELMRSYLRRAPWLHELLPSLNPLPF